MSTRRRLEGPLGEPIGVSEVAELFGCSPWTVRHRLIPNGMPHCRAGAGGRLVFHRCLVVAWIKDQIRKQTRKGGLF